jgi:nicotinate-nucleotide adenylyltransferase
MGITQNYLERCDKLAVMGGTFDPIHYGHLAVAEAVMHEIKPRCILFMPGGQPPHKNSKPVTSAEHRYNMALSAICEYPCFDISRMEIDGEGFSYTVDTIKTLRDICPSDAEIYFILGADALMEILTWEGAERLLKLCKFVAVHRPGYEIDNACAENLRTNYGAEIHMLEGPNLNISGTEIRKRFSAGQPVGGLIPRIAEDYARINGLYGLPEPALTPERFEAVKTIIKNRLSPRRFNHTLGTVTESEKLAAHYGADVNKARWAALLHDCAKEYSADKKRRLCKLWGIELDSILSADIDIAHSMLGAESALRDFQVNDPEILQAISRHTIGQSKMSLLDKIIMLADYIEPYRDKSYPPLAAMRETAYKDIDKALLIGMKDTNEDLKKRGKPVHPWSDDVMKELKQ